MPNGTSSPARKPAVASPRVLVVEDDAAMRELLDESLSQEGFEVIVAADAGTALRVLEAQSVHAVVTDLNLGGVNGIELCQRVHALDATLPVVLITALNPSFETSPIVVTENNALKSDGAPAGV